MKEKKLKNDRNALIDVKMNKNSDVKIFKRGWGLRLFLGLRLFQTLEEVARSIIFNYVLIRIYES